MRCSWLVMLCVGCAGAHTSKFAHLIDPPFIQPAAAGTQTTVIGGTTTIGGAAGNSIAGAQGSLTVELPKVTITRPAFFSVSLEGANDLVFLVDRSGSMLGRKLDQAKAELLRVLAALPDGTRFNLVFFGDRVTPLSAQPLTLDSAVREQTQKFLRRIDVQNSTALVPALDVADHMHTRRVVLLSDGQGNVMGGLDETLVMGRAMIRKGVRFDAVVLMKRDVPCHEHTGTKLANTYSAGSAAACEAEHAAAVLRKLADESGGAFSDPLAPN